MGVMRFDLAQGETLNIDDGKVRVTLEQKSGSRARIRIQADDSIIVSMDHEESSKSTHKAFSRPQTA